MATDPMFDAITNLARYHRDHEKFYAQEPRAQAVTVQRHARALQALADRWAEGDAGAQQPSVSPFEGSVDLNADTAVQLDGILFMEGEGEPAEIVRLKAEVRTLADAEEQTGRWLADAMAVTWSAATVLFSAPELADQLGERHQIIANDWQAAEMSSLAGRLLARSVEILDLVDFAPTALRADLAGDRRAPVLLYAAAELMGRAADLLSDSAGLVRDNERRWRVFRARVEEYLRES